MEDKEFEIAGRLLGGYNKKQTERYIRELQKMIGEAQSALKEAEDVNTGLEQKLLEAENCYKVLWERSKGQEKTIRVQSETIIQQKQVIENQKKTIDNQLEVFSKQEQLFAEQIKKAEAISSDNIEKLIKKQIKESKKNQKKKGMHKN